MHFDKLFIQNSIFMGKWRNDKKMIIIIIMFSRHWRGDTEPLRQTPWLLCHLEMKTQEVVYSCRLDGGGICFQLLSEETSTYKERQEK